MAREDDEPLLPFAAAARFELPAAAPLPRPDPLFPPAPCPLAAFPLAALPLALFPPLRPDAAFVAVPRLDVDLLDLVVAEPFPLPEPDPVRADLERPWLDVERPLLDVERPLLDVERPLLDAERDPEDAVSSASARRRACASFAIRSPDAFPLRNFRAAVARLTEAASLAAACALRGLLAVVAMS